MQVDMKRVFVFIGSQKYDSYTAQFTRQILDRVQKGFESSKEELIVEFYTSKDLNIKSCQSCLNCFINGTCPLDITDDMAQIKSKIMQSDFIIFGSPVYAHNVSGDMKKFIDRISSWTHLLILAGKSGAIISSTLNNGNMFVHDYLYKIMSYLGIKIVGKFSATKIDQMIQDEESFQNEIDIYAKNLLRHMLDEKMIRSDNYLERLFQVMKQNAKDQELMGTYEYTFWKEAGYLNCDTFEELLQFVDQKQKLVNH